MEDFIAAVSATPDSIPGSESPAYSLSLVYILDNLPLASFVCDPEGLITYCNERAVELWGRKPRINDAHDRYCGSFRLYWPNGERMGHDQCWMALALRNRRSYNDMEVVIERSDGRRLTALAYANPIVDRSGRLIGAVNVLLDISERKQGEETRRRNLAAMAHLGRIHLAGEMAAGLAHELNQPLTAINNYSEMCARLARYDNTHIEDIVEGLDQVAQQARLAGDIIRRLRNFTRKATFRPEPCDLDTLVRESVDFLGTEIRHSQVSLHIETGGSSLQVYADPVQIQQVLLNLIRNSLDAMNEVAVADRKLLIGAALEADDTITITVSDTGPGLPDEIQRKLFHPFLTTKPAGVGLGLSISKSIIEAHGGQLWANPNPERGVSFRFSLPRTRSRGNA